MVTTPQPIMIREIVGFGPKRLSKKLDGTVIVSCDRLSLGSTKLRLPVLNCCRNLETLLHSHSNRMYGTKKMATTSVYRGPVRLSLQSGTFNGGIPTSRSWWSHPWPHCLESEHFPSWSDRYN